MTKRPGKEDGKSHPETTDDRPGDNPQAAKEEARELRPNPETAGGSDNILDSEFEATDERGLEPQERKSPPLTEPADNALVDRVIPDAEPHTGAVAVLPRERAYLVSPRTLRNLFVASNVAGVLIIVVILTLASSAPQGRYTPADETQYQRTLVEATDAISTTAPNEGGDTARIPIADAIALVAERGVTEVTATLAEAPAAAAGEAPAEAVPTPAAPPPAPDTEGAPVPQGADPAAEGAAPPAGTAATGDTAAPAETAPTDETTAEAPPGAPAATPVVDTAAGQAVYEANCASCHQTTGEGIPGAFPALVGHVPALYNASREYLVNLQLYGLQGEIQIGGQTYNGVMPAWAQLSDDDIANVLNYVSTAWGNEAQLQSFEPYTAADVAPLRDAGLTSQDVYALRQELALGGE